MARLILPLGFHDYDFIKMMKHERHGRNRIRLLAMYHLQLGKSLKVISTLVRVHWKTVQSWLRRFRNHGFDGLFESHRSGASKKLNKIEESFIVETINNLSDNNTGGYITGKELHKMLTEKYETKCSLRTVYNTLHRLGFSWITSRSKHPKSNQVTQDEYKKTLPIS